MCARVLIIDDDRISIDLLTHLLRAYGHEAIAATGGEEGLLEASSCKPDVILCDIEMPGVSGFDVLNRVRRSAALRGTPVIGLTALALWGDREKILSAGFDGYLSKPITPEMFVDELHRYLPAEMVRRDAAPTSKLVPSATLAARLPRTRGGYAIVVDDTAANIDLMKHMIGSIGMEVVGASTVDEALRLARERRPTLIISDLHMPERDGLDLLSSMKQDRHLKDVPFVLASATIANVSEERRATELGADGMLFRPIDAEDMFRYLSRWIPMESAP